MVDISNVVQVTISRETASVTQAGFGTMLILGSNATFSERVREYESLTEVAEDFATTDDEYLAAQAAFSQDPSPENIKIGRRDTSIAMQQILTFDSDLVTGNSIDVTIDGVAITTVSFNTDHATTMSDLATELQAHPSIATATITGTHEITLVATTAGVPFDIDSVTVSGGASQATATSATTVENIGVTEDLNNIVLEDDDWYALVLTSTTQDEQEFASDWIETQRKIFCIRTSNSSVYDSTSTDDIASYISNNNYDRSFVIFNEENDDYVDASWLGRCLPEDPGSITWKFKELSGITASDSLSSTQRNAILDKNANLISTIGGVSMTEEGTVGSGEYIDVIRDVDWIQARLEEAIFQKLVNLGKIPYTDSGVAIVENEIRGVLRRAINQGILASDPEFEVTVPLVADVSDTDKANRLLPDVEFTATLAGAIHKVQIAGTVSV